MQRLVLPILAMLLVICLSACATGMTREDLLQQMQQGTRMLIVDLRSQGEYDEDHIPGAVQIPFYAVRSGVREIGWSKTDLLVLYCEHGPRSGIASFTLYLSGYERIYSLDGHMQGWRKNEFPIERLTP
jgi:rhodanese-related sulfurtransferase